MVDEKLTGIILPPGIEHAPALKHDDALPIDLFVQSRFLKERVQMGHRFFIELQGIKTQGQPAPREVGFGMISILAKEALELGYRNRIELPVISGVGDEVFLQRRVILGLKGAKSKPQNKKRKTKVAKIRLRFHYRWVGRKEDIGKKWAIALAVAYWLIGSRSNPAPEGFFYRNN